MSTIQVQSTIARGFDLVPHGLARAVSFATKPCGSAIRAVGQRVSDAFTEDKRASRYARDDAVAYLPTSMFAAIPVVGLLVAGVMGVMTRLFGNDLEASRRFQTTAVLSATATGAALLCGASIPVLAVACFAAAAPEICKELAAAVRPLKYYGDIG